MQNQAKGWTTTFHHEVSWLEKKLQKQGIRIITELHDNNHPNLSIYVIRDMH
jgi:hypothetical protein